MKAEQEALLGYLEFNLTTMVESIQKKLCATLSDDDIGVLYDSAYEVLNEIERSLDEAYEHELVSR